MARAAHIKPATWGRYGAAQRSFNEFWAELEPTLPAREPPYDEADVGLWLGDLVAREVVSAATMLAGLNNQRRRAAPARGTVHPASAGRLVAHQTTP